MVPVPIRSDTDPDMGYGKIQLGYSVKFLRYSSFILWEKKPNLCPPFMPSIERKGKKWALFLKEKKKGLQGEVGGEGEERKREKMK